MQTPIFLKVWDTISVLHYSLLFLSAGLILGSATSAEAQIMKTTDANAYELKIGSARFRLPYLYLERRPQKISLGKIHEWTHHFDFAFWMPDGRPLLDNPMSTIGYRPKENGQVQSADSYVVHVRQVVPVLSDVSYVSPRKKISNLDRVMRLTDQKVFRSDSMFGLMKYEPKDPGQAAFYAGNANEEPQILISCPARTKKIPHPSCIESVFYEDERIGLTIQLPLFALDQWKSVADKTLQLVKSWRVLN